MPSTREPRIRSGYRGPPPGSSRASQVAARSTMSCRRCWRSCWPSEVSRRVRIPHTSVSREMIAQLDLSAVKVITVSYLELAGAPAHLRYLIRRLRHRAPHAALIAGLWPQGEAVLNEPQAQKALGGDRYVASLREAIDASLAALSDPSASQDSVADGVRPGLVIGRAGVTARPSVRVSAVFATWSGCGRWPCGRGVRSWWCRRLPGRQQSVLRRSSRVSRIDRRRRRQLALHERPHLPGGTIAAV